MRHLQKSAGLILVCALFLCCAAVWAALLAQGGLLAAVASVPGQLTVAVLDIGQGDSIYIESPTGVQVLVDGGPGNALLQALPGVMPPLDRSLDAIVETHPDADHIGGFVELLARYHVGAFVSPGIPKPTATNKKLEEEVDAQKILRVLARRGMVMDLGGGAVLRVLYPDHDVSALASDQANEGGVVAELVYGQSEMLLMADVGAGVEARLLALDAAELDSDILKVGHHGSRFSTSEAFVRAVSPDVAIISVGAKNTYGHPTQEVLDRLGKYTVKILRTDQDGTVMCTSLGIQFTCE